MMRMRWRGAAPLLAIAALGAASVGWRSLAPPFRHELSQTSATLVVREGGHVQLRLQVPWADVLREQWSPATPMQEFLVRVTAQRPEEFARALSRLEASVEGAARVAADASGGVTFVRWEWPSSASVQDALRRELMSRLVEPADFEHASRLGAVAERSLGRDPSRIRVQLPALLGPVLLTVYRPTEQWLQPGIPSVPVNIRHAAAR